MHILGQVEAVYEKSICVPGDLWEGGFNAEPFGRVLVVQFECDQCTRAALGVEPVPLAVEVQQGRFLFRSAPGEGLGTNTVHIATSWQ